MGALSLLFNASIIRPHCTSPGFAAGWPQNRLPSSSYPSDPVRLPSRARPCVRSPYRGPEEEESCVEELRFPESWWVPSRASEEAEWLRVSLRKWLDDEYCPEDTNVEISKFAANATSPCWRNEPTWGEILLRMARELETISHRDSFHGDFSAANAAVNFIVQRIDEE